MRSLELRGASLTHRLGSSSSQRDCTLTFAAALPPDRSSASFPSQAASFAFALLVGWFAVSVRLDQRTAFGVSVKPLH